MRLHPGLVALALLTSQVALAQKVVVLEFEGDKGARLRAQVESATRKARQVELVSIADWKAAAKKKKLAGAQAMTPSAVARLSSAVEIDAAVEGALGETFFVRILDGQGNELWSKDLPLKKGLISDDHAKKLAKAIAAAAKTAGQPRVSEPEPEPEKPEPAGKKGKKPGEEGEGGEEGGGEQAGEGGEAQPDEPRRKPSIGLSESERRRAEEEAEAQASMRAAQEQADEDRDLEDETAKKEFKVRPKIVAVKGLGYTLTWRSYCSRPGVTSCAEYDALPEAGRPTGDTVEFSPQVPYSGFRIKDLEIFPLSTLWEKMAGFGFGVIGNFGMGFSLTNVSIQLPTGSTETQQVVSVDRAWSAEFAVRWHFSMGTSKHRGVSYLGARLGGGGQTFEVDASANVPLPGPDRTFFLVGAELYLAPVKWVGLKARFSALLGATPGATVILGYGDLNHASGGAESQGYLLEGGLEGEAFGPVGYSLMIRHEWYVDQFKGQGKKWTTPCDPDGSRCGGVDEERYTQLILSAVLAF